MLTYINKKISQLFKSYKSLTFYWRNRKTIGISGADYLKLIKHGDDKENLDIKFLNKTISISSSFWFLHSVHELFIDEVYKFETGNSKPIIIDCGANWGLSIIYLKKQHPGAIITAFEPDKKIFTLLRKNIESFGFEDVTLINKAVWKNNNNLKFSSEGTLGGTITGLGIPEYNVIEVETSRLRDVLMEYEKIDFLKIDIEAAEYDVVKDCADELHRADRLFIEYHSIPGNPQQLDEILMFVKNAGFRYYIKEAWNNMQYPFSQDKNLYYDLQLNIFCFRQ